jgi:UDPglucose 6-dehydrogenase
VVITEWSEFVDLDWHTVAETMSAPRIVFDGRNCLDAAAVESAGLTYMAVGRPGSHRGGPA